MKNIIIELIVNNHPGVMSHVTGLFSRRSFNLEGILCSAIGNSSKSRMLLLVNDDNRIEQIVKQLEKLHDVLNTSVKEDYDHGNFNSLHSFLKVE